MKWNIYSLNLVKFLQPFIFQDSPPIKEVTEPPGRHSAVEGRSQSWMVFILPEGENQFKNYLEFITMTLFWLWPLKEFPRDLETKEFRKSVVLGSRTRWRNIHSPAPNHLECTCKHLGPQFLTLQKNDRLNKMFLRFFFMSGNPGLSDVKPMVLVLVLVFFTSLSSELLCFFLAPLSFLLFVLYLLYFCLISVIFVSLGQSCLPYAE